MIKKESNSLTAKIYNEKNIDYKVAVNNRRKPITKFGYNKGGDECVILTVNGAPF